MALMTVKINGFKSLNNLEINLISNNFFIGENGVGKSNILDAIEYFYKNLSTNSQLNNIFDKNNYKNNEMMIELEFSPKKVELVNNVNKSEQGKYLDKILSLKDPKSNTIKVVMKQIKGGKITWNHGYEDRQIIKAVFPFYRLSVDDIKENSWEAIWELISDIVKIPNSEENTIFENLSNSVGSIKIDKNLSKIKSIFSGLSVDLQKWTPREFSFQLSQFLFRGNSFISDEKDMDYYSSGTRSLKYINLYFEMLSLLSSEKIKMPILIVDEIEQYLHHKFIDELFTSITCLSENVTTLISTHSSRLIKMIITNNFTSNIFQVSKKCNYSYFQKLSLYNEEEISRLKGRLTDEHSNAYFSSVMLLVEGESELELFNNSHLAEVFPILTKVDVFKSITDMIVHDKISPSSINSSIPYLALIDLDKIALFQPEKDTLSRYKCFILKKGSTFYNRIDRNKESYLFPSNNHVNIRLLRYRIEKMIEKYYFVNDELGGSNSSPYLSQLKKALNLYMQNYNFFVMPTTLEQGLINTNTLPYLTGFIKYRKIKNVPPENRKSCLQKIEKVLKDSKTMSLNEQLNFFRMVFGGKNDLLLTGINNPLEEKYPNHKDFSFQAKKTTWISDFLQFYIVSVSSELKIEDIDFYTVSTDKFEKSEINRKNLNIVREKMKIDFPIIVNILELLQKKYYYRKDCK